MFIRFYITSIALEKRDRPCWVSLVGCAVVIAGKMQAEAEIARPVTILAFESLAPQGFSGAVLLWGKVLPTKAVFQFFMVTPTGTNTIIHEHTLNLNLWRKIAYGKNTIR
ncbi:MAG: hypothetical protein LUH09_09570 [Clostridiales bacterium]|nr:hypothetical protein [Clostridiales bacterium]